MIGTWLGYYQFDNANYQKAMGFDKTFFTIEINSFDGKHFEGIVNDDVKSGGMEDTGKIVGEIKEGNVYFKKLMPKESLLYPNGERKSSNRKHPTLYYSGVISNDKKEINGVWKFRFTTVFLLGFIPIPYRLGKGTWSMTLQ